MSACSSFEPSRAINNQICRLFMITHVLHETQWIEILSEGANLWVFLMTSMKRATVRKYEKLCLPVGRVVRASTKNQTCK